MNTRQSILFYILAIVEVQNQYQNMNFALHKPARDSEKRESDHFVKDKAIEQNYIFRIWDHFSNS